MILLGSLYMICTKNIMIKIEIDKAKNLPIRHLNYWKPIIIDRIDALIGNYLIVDPQLARLGFSKITTKTTFVKSIDLISQSPILLNSYERLLSLLKLNLDVILIGK